MHKYNSKTIPVLIIFVVEVSCQHTETCKYIDSPIQCTAGKGVNVKIRLRVLDGVNDAPLPGVNLCEYNIWYYSNKNIDRYSLIGTSNALGNIEQTQFVFENGVVEGVLLKPGYELLRLRLVGVNGATVDAGTVKMQPEVK